MVAREYGSTYIIDVFAVLPFFHRGTSLCEIALQPILVLAFELMKQKTWDKGLLEKQAIGNAYDERFLRALFRGDGRFVVVPGLLQGSGGLVLLLYGVVDVVLSLVCALEWNAGERVK